MTENNWVWAAKQLARRWYLVAILLLMTAMLYVQEDAMAQSYLIFIAPIMALFAVLELLFFHAALAQKGAAPASLRDRGVLAGFFWRWAVLLLLFGFLPVVATLGFVLTGATSYPDLALGRVLTMIGTLSWWLGYALMGPALPAFLSRRPGGLGEAATRPGLVRRLRLLAPAGALHLAASLMSNEIVSGEFDWLGDAVDGFPSNLALLSLPTDLILILCSALTARILTDHMFEDEKLGSEAVRAFE